jgi:hypothetical protein
MAGLVAPLECKNGWALAERAGKANPIGMQRLLGEADWDADGVRDDVRDIVVESIGDKNAVPIGDDTGFWKSEFLPFDHVMPRVASGRVALRAWWRSPAVMLVCPMRRKAPMARLRGLAVALGAVPVRTREASSVEAVSRT